MKAYFIYKKFGKELLEEYNSIVKHNYKDNFNLKILNVKDKIVKGSNSSSRVLIDKILQKYYLRVANSSDFQMILGENKTFLREFYVDLGLVLRTVDDPNEYLAGQLGKQAKERNYKFSNLNPLVFKSSDLELTLDNNSPSGLGFKINDSAKPFNAPELNYKNNDKKFKITNENGVPIFDKNGVRTIYTANNGLSRFVLFRGSYLNSGIDILESSDLDGRIVIVDDDKIDFP